MTESKPRSPAGLGPAGRKFWRDVVGVYDLDPHELHVLAEASRTLDEMERVRAELDAAPSLLAKGSMGQAVEHPLLGTLRNHRASLDKLIARLNLPDSEGEVPKTPAQVRAQRANDVRWATRRAQKAAERATDLRAAGRGA